MCIDVISCRLVDSRAFNKLSDFDVCANLKRLHHINVDHLWNLIYHPVSLLSAQRRRRLRERLSNRTVSRTNSDSSLPDSSLPPQLPNNSTLPATTNAPSSVDEAPVRVEPASPSDPTLLSSRVIAQRRRQQRERTYSTTVSSDQSDVAVQTRRRSRLPYNGRHSTAPARHRSRRPPLFRRITWGLSPIFAPLAMHCTGPQRRGLRHRLKIRNTPTVAGPVMLTFHILTPYLSSFSTCMKRMTVVPANSEATSTPVSVYRPFTPRRVLPYPVYVGSHSALALSSRFSLCVIYTIFLLLLHCSFCSFLEDPLGPVLDHFAAYTLRHLLSASTSALSCHLVRSRVFNKPRVLSDHVSVVHCL